LLDRIDGRGGPARDRPEAAAAAVKNGGGAVE
jgi:hypothetical protein